MATVITKKFKIYKYEELDDEAKEKVRYNNYMQCSDFLFNLDDVHKSLEEFAKVFDLDITDYGYGRNDGSDFINFSYSYEYEEVEDFVNLRLFKYIFNNYYSYFSKGKYYSTPKRNIKEIDFVIRYSKISKVVDCPLTGICYDHSLLDPIMKFINDYREYKDYTFEELINECLDNFITDINKEIDYSGSEEYAKEMAEDNDCIYLENGDLYN